VLIATDDGVDLDVRLREGGPSATVLVHGLASSAGLWEPVAQRLANAGHTVASVDLRGHGRSGSPAQPGDWSTPRAARDVAQVIEQLRLRHPVVAGQSWGGNVVIELAATRPELVGGIVAVDGGLIHLAEGFTTFEQCWEALAPPELDGLTRGQLEAMHEDWEPAAVQGLLDCFTELADGSILPRLTRDHHRRVLQGLFEHDPFALLPLPVPLTVVAAGPGIIVHQLPRALGARTLVVEGVHDLHAQQPELIASIILEQHAPS
jgi:pimeloyl-ACP methyl ester carboxylesterase